MLLVLLLATGALAQTVSSTTGAIDGKVTDTSNAVLPGVTVTIASDAMMGTRDSVTTGTGTFRFVSITPGLYTVTFDLPGFATVKRTDIQVGAGFTATLNIAMQVAGLEEAVTVTGASPVVDTQATKISTSFDSKMLAQTPNGSNDPWAMLAETPAVKMSRIDVGGSTAGTQTTFTAYGTGGQRPYYEGINGTEGTNANGNYPDMNAFDEVAVNTVGNNAEMGPPGVMMVFVVKSGGNTYHGSTGINYSDGKWQSFNIDADQIARGVLGGGGLKPEDTNRLTRFRDSFAQLGGYIQKDKLWWFGAVRESLNQVRLTNFPVKPFETTLQVYQGKGTYQLSQNNKFIGYYQFNAKIQPDRLDRFQLTATTGIHLSDDSQFRQYQGNFVSKFEYNSVISDAMFFEVRTGQWGYYRKFENETTAPSYEDTTTRLASGAAQNRWDRPRRNQVNGSLSYFREGLGGTHNVKFGWEVFRETTTGGCCDVGAYNDVVHILRNGAPLEVFLLGNPAESTEGMWNTGLYVTDTYRAGNKLTLNLGLRYDRYDNFLSEQQHVADRFFPDTVTFPAREHVRVWNTMAPRFGVSYNLSGDGRTVIKGSWGLFFGNPGTGSSNPNGTWQKRYAWTVDRNANKVWDPGEEGRLISSSGGVATTSLDPDQKDDQTYDMSVWIERELINNLGIRGGFVHRIERRFRGTINTNQPFDAFNVATTVRDPGLDGTVGTADDGALINATNLAAAYLGLPTVSLVTNVPGRSTYDTYEIAMNKRMSDRWSSSISYSYTRRNAYRTASNTYPLNPNSCINANADCQDESSDYSFKLNGVFELPAGVKLSPVYRFQAGNNFGRTFVATLNYANPTLLAEPLNAQRAANINLLDIRLDRGFALPGGRLSPFVDIYNLTNSNAEQDITVTSGTSYLRPITIVPPRVLRIGAKFDW
jgi:hypothetical protein